MVDPRRLRARTRAQINVTLLTAGAVVSTAAGSAVIGARTAAAFPRPQAPAMLTTTPPAVPLLAPPHQEAAPTPAVITTVVHVPAPAVSGGGGVIQAPARGVHPAAPRGRPAAGGSAALPPPPPPAAACISTPSRPC